jgi:signal recognition particle subunit SEC65
MLRPWNPTKEEIKSWLKTKELEFVQKDNKNPRVTPHKYLEKYVFTDLHEVFFCDFPHLLQEWILRLKDNHATNQISKS